MKTEYRRTNTTVSMINYHLVFCPRYRRKIFLIEGVEARFKELVTQICETNGVKVLAINCDTDYCHLFINTPPEIGPPDVMRLIKMHTTSQLRTNFKKLEKCPSIWTRNYFVSTEENLSFETVQKYVESQKKKDY